MLSQLGPYIIDEELAQGGMARVFRARLRGLGGFEKTLVIKQIRSELANDPRFVEMFVREANTLVSLSHPHIVPVYELGAADGTYYLSMEYVEGATVLEMVKQGPLAPALVAHLGAQVCEALEYAHGRFGILHRDLTPRNIIIDQAGHTRVVDFGIAAPEGASDPGAFGSPGYMSPEQVEQRHVTAQSDLFSLGAVLFEALTGQAAFSKSDRGSLAPTPGYGACQVPEPLAGLVLSMLAPMPAARPGSAAEVGRTLRAFLARTNPHGVLEEMQRRVEQARSAPKESPVPSALTQPATARIEARAIATSQVLTEILRSSAFAPIPQPPVALEASSGEGTRPIRERAEVRAAARQHHDDAGEPSRNLRELAERDPTNGKLTALLMRAWPFVALLSLATAWLLHKRNEPVAPTRSTPAQGEVVHRLGSPAEPRASAVQPAPVEPIEPAAPSAPPAKTEPAAASVSINAKPWAEVTIDGRPAGTTPLRKLKLPPGTHLLQLSCPPLGRSQTLKLDFGSAQPARIVVDLTVSPARTFLDGVREAR